MTQRKSQIFSAILLSELYEKVVGTPETLLDYVIIQTGNGDNIELEATNENFVNLDHPDPIELLGRCFSVKIPNGTQISNVYVKGNDEIDIRFYPPGNTYNPDFKYMHVQPFMQNDLDLNNEIFEVLDYDGIECKVYNETFSRDNCIENYITSKTMDDIGCTTPYLSNRENICTDQNKAMEAFNFYR